MQPTAENAKAWSDFFRDAGGWGMFVLTLVGSFLIIRKLWNELKETQARYMAVLDKTNNIMELLVKNTKRLPPGDD